MFWFPQINFSESINTRTIRLPMDVDRRRKTSPLIRVRKTRVKTDQHVWNNINLLIITSFECRRPKLFFDVYAHIALVLYSNNVTKHGRVNNTIKYYIDLFEVLRTYAVNNISRLFFLRRSDKLNVQMSKLYISVRLFHELMLLKSLCIFNNNIVESCAHLDGAKKHF